MGASNLPCKVYSALKRVFRVVEVFLIPSFDPFDGADAPAAPAAAVDVVVDAPRPLVSFCNGFSSNRNVPKRHTYSTRIEERKNQKRGRVRGGERK